MIIMQMVKNDTLRDFLNMFFFSVGCDFIIFIVIDVLYFIIYCYYLYNAWQWQYICMRYSRGNIHYILIQCFFIVPKPALIKSPITNSTFSNFYIYI